MTADRPFNNVVRRFELHSTGLDDEWVTADDDLGDPGDPETLPKVVVIVDLNAAMIGAHTCRSGCYGIDESGRRVIMAPAPSGWLTPRGAAQLVVFTDDTVAVATPAAIAAYLERTGQTGG